MISFGSFLVGLVAVSILVGTVAYILGYERGVRVGQILDRQSRDGGIVR